MVGLVFGLSTGVAAQDVEVATIDMQEVLMAHPAIQDAQQELQEEQMAMMEELEELDEEEAQAQQMEMQEDLEMLQQELLEGAMDEAAADIDSAAADLGYDVVVDEEGVVSGEEELGADNITEEIMEELDLDADMEDPMGF